MKNFVIIVFILFFVVNFFILTQMPKCYEQIVTTPNKKQGSFNVIESDQLKNQKTPGELFDQPNTYPYPAATYPQPTQYAWISTHPKNRICQKVYANNLLKWPPGYQLYSSYHKCINDKNPILPQRDKCIN